MHTHQVQRVTISSLPNAFHPRTTHPSAPPLCVCATEMSGPAHALVRCSLPSLSSLPSALCPAGSVLSNIPSRVNFFRPGGDKRKPANIKPVNRWLSMSQNPYIITKAARCTALLLRLVLVWGCWLRAASSPALARACPDDNSAPVSFICCRQV
jgi:hypothetical protein